jgi:hypothetical protein
MLASRNSDSVTVRWVSVAESMSVLMNGYAEPSFKPVETVYWKIFEKNGT